MGCSCAAAFAALRAPHTVRRPCRSSQEEHADASSSDEQSTATGTSASSTLGSDGSYEGYSVELAKAVGERVGAEVRFIAPDIELITAGRWNGRWDLASVEMTPTPERQKIMNLSTPYVFNVIRLVVPEDSAVTGPEQLTGRRVGVVGGTSPDLYVRGQLELANFPYDGRATRVESALRDVDLKSYKSETDAFADLQLGAGKRLDAVIAAQGAVQAARESGVRIKAVGPPLLLEPGTLAADLTADSESLIEEASATIDELAANGGLVKLFEEAGARVRPGGLDAYTAFLESGDMPAGFEGDDYTLIAR